jgi:hypothetical protein
MEYIFDIERSIKMDVFEYGCVYLEFIKNEKKSEGGDWIADGFVIVDLYIEGEKKQSKVSIAGDFYYEDHEERLRGGTLTRHVVSVSRNYSISQLTKVLSGLGCDGWEVVEYKTNNDPAFGQALLKRRVQK